MRQQGCGSKGSSPFDPQPCWRNHHRLSLDGTQGIFRAKFDGSEIDVPTFIAWMATTFDKPPETIGEVTDYNKYGRTSTFSYPAGVTDRIRIGVLGFVEGQGWPSWEQSHEAVLAYIYDHIEDWEAAEP